MRKYQFKLFIVLLVFFYLIFNINSAVQVFSKYDNLLEIHSNNTIDVKKSLTIKNVYSVGIVPGQIEFKVGKSTDGSLKTIDVENVIAIDSFGTKLPARIRKNSKYSVIIVDVYYPLLPGFEYSFDLSYTIKYEPGGIFFKSLQIPLRESTIPIQKGTFSVKLPENYYFTYLHSDNGLGRIENGIAKWDIENDEPKSISFEYSYIPIKVSEFRGSYVFWITINIILLLILIYEVRREIKRIREQYGE